MDHNMLVAGTGLLIVLLFIVGGATWAWRGMRREREADARRKN
jgi:cbb3-type cytochrome oxidase subunit 3